MATASVFPPGSTLAEVDASLQPHGLKLLRAWPRDEHHLLLEAGRDGATVAGQWFASADRAADVTRRTPHARQIGRIVLQPDGADRRLRGLAALLSRSGAELVAHRPERRGVVRLHGAFAGPVVYAKVVRETALQGVARTARLAANLPVRTPAVVEVDAATSAVMTTALPGRTLHDLLATPAGPQACRAAGAALGQLHRSPVPDDLLRLHGDADERAVVLRWQRLAAAHGLSPAFPSHDADPTRDEPGERGEPGELALLHRDFHDKQVIVDDDGQVGLLDFDLLALGSPVMDLANFLTHLDLRVRQGLVPDAAPLRAAVLEGYQPTPGQLAQLHHHERTTWQRLSAVYAFRPPWTTT